MKTTYKIGIYDDHPIVTDAVRNLLIAEDSLDLVLIAHSKNELLSELTKNNLDALIVDVVTPDVSGLELFKELKEHFPNLKLLAYTTLSSLILIENILMAGAEAYVNKRQPPADLIVALKKVCEGKHYVAEQYSFLLKDINKGDEAVELTKREEEILELILEGKLSKEIAEILFISKNTVENHRTNLFKKFQVSNLAELFRKAAHLGYFR